MEIIGKLVNKKIIIKRPRNVGRLYDKSCFGKKNKDGTLNLDLIEGVFLL